MRRDIWQKRIPSILGIVMIVLGLGVTSYLVKSGVLFITRASPDNTPKNVRITNVSDSSFSISYTTSKQVSGAVSFGTLPGNLTDTALDDRDQQGGNVGSYNLHHISLKNLKPSTVYYFSITSGKDTFLNNNLPFKQSTGIKILSSPPYQNAVTGHIVNTNGQVPAEAIIYITTQGAQTLSSLSDKKGNYIIPINSIRLDNFGSYVPVSGNTIFNMLAVDETLEESNVTFYINQANPLPLVTISKDYNFTSVNTPVASVSANPEVHFPSLSAEIGTPIPGRTTKITVPKQNEGFTDQQPTFSGTASPSANVKITIHSQTPINITVQADGNGNWTFRPDQRLAPGNHTISITAMDKSGIIKTITQNFTVYAAGTQISGTAVISPSPTSVTPDLTPSPTATPSPSASPTAELTSALSPTEIVTQSAIITLSPTPSPTPTILVTQTPKSMVSGNSSAIFIGIAGIATAVSGAVIFILSHGGI